MSAREWRLHGASLAIGGLLAATAPCWASGSLGALLACRNIETGAARLACFDRESAALSGQRQQNAVAARAELSPRETFGLAPLEVAARAEAAAHAPKPIDSLTARISSIAKAADGREVFGLDNHQVWIQLVADGSWLEARAGEPVTISRGWLGSYWLRLPQGGFKVTRLR